MVVEVLWSDVGSVGPEYGVVEAKLNKLLQIAKFLKSRIFKQWSKVDALAYTIGKFA